MSNFRDGGVDNRETCIIWVCDNCMFHHANGECGDCYGEDGHVREPWVLLSSDHAHGNTTMGMLAEEHEWECDGFGCDCEINTFSMSSCDGCGSRLCGQRHAFTLWGSK